MKVLPGVTLLLLLTVSCSTGRKLHELKEGMIAPNLSISDYVQPAELDIEANHRDTLTVRDADGRELIIMKAVRDEDGEMVATERLDASVVIASFKNVAERHGSVDLRFNLIVPDTMIDSKWQLRLQPVLHMLGNTSALDKLVITGEQYRKTQLKGYQQYQRFLDSIITDSSAFVQKRRLELFLERNIPAIYALKNDSTYVSDEYFESLYGVTEREAVAHYTDHFRLGINRRRYNRRDEIFHRYVKVPISMSGLRLDTVLRNPGGGVRYEYVQTIKTMPRLRKAGITVCGGIYEGDQRVYCIPESDSLTFYISSLSSLVDPAEKYMTRIIERCVTDNSVCWIEFGAGKSDVNPSLGNNETEMRRITDNLRQLLSDGVFDLDSITVTASSSPEGSFEMNRKLSRLRSRSVCRYFSDYVDSYKDSIRMSEGVRMNLGGFPDVSASVFPQFSFIPRDVSENWDMLDRLVRDDDRLDEKAKEEYFNLSSENNPDLRERKMSSLSSYRYLREELYPRLRTVRFDFFLHRKGMLRDTVYTTELDTMYMHGVQMIRDREYEAALSILKSYRDFNTAVAYSALDYNESALEVLKELPCNDRTEYLKALLYSRKGDDQMAVQCYLNSCNANPSYIHRGNLDPEISTLIKRYNIKFE